MTHIPRIESRINPALRDLLVRLASGAADWPLFLYGATGRGKTCAALWLLDSVPMSLYRTVDGCIRDLLRRDEEVWASNRGYILAVVDELGLRSMENDLEYAAIKRMADCREHRPTIWISNHAPERISSIYDDRIYSRICSGTWFHLEGADQRML